MMKWFLLTFICVFLSAPCLSASIHTNEYNAEVLRVLDGDTIELRISLGFGITMDSHCRLYGVNAPELHGESYTNALKAKNFVISMVSKKSVKLLTLNDKRDKYGRVLGIIMVGDKNVNKMLLERKYVVPMGDDGSKVIDRDIDKDVIPVPDLTSIYLNHPFRMTFGL